MSIVSRNRFSGIVRKSFQWRFLSSFFWFNPLDFRKLGRIESKVSIILQNMNRHENLVFVLFTGNADHTVRFGGTNAGVGYDYH